MTSSQPLPSGDALVDEATAEGFFVDLVVDVGSIMTPLTYRVPTEIGDSVSIGDRFLVPLASRMESGWVVDLAPQVPKRLKSIRQVGRFISVGPPPEVASLCLSASLLWASSPAPFLKAASPKRDIAKAKLDWSTRRGSTLEVGPMFARPGSIIWEAPNYDAVGWAKSVFDHYCRRGYSIIVVAPVGARVDAIRAALIRLGLPVLSYPDDYLRIALSDSPVVVVGSRTAVLAPVANLGSIVVLDGVDPAMREQASPHWEAWRLAELRSKSAGAELLLVGAAPAVEALASDLVVRHPDRSRYLSGWSSTEVISDPQELGPDLLGRLGRYRDASKRISESTSVALDYELILIHNAKGFSSQLTCSKCGELQRCEACSSLVGSVGDRELDVVRSKVESIRRKVIPFRLICPNCSLARPVVCQSCGSTRVKPTKSGVDRLAPTVEGILGESISVVTKGTDTKGPSGARVAVGTEAILLRSVRAAVVVFVDFDRWVHSVSLERLVRTVYHLARASQIVSDAQGVVYLQQRAGSDPISDAVLLRSVGPLYRQEMAQRRSLGLPPSRFFAKLTGKRVAEVKVALMQMDHGDRVEVFDIDEGTVLVAADVESELGDVVRSVTVGSSGLKVELYPRNL